jgi:glycosyltransferase involved in cell wall biosynthesis
MARTLLLITAAFPPSAGGGVIRVTKLIKYITRHGWQPTVLTSVPTEGEPQDADLVAELGDSVHIIRVQPPIAFAGRALRSARRRADKGGVARALVRGVRTLVWSVVVPDRALGWALRASRTKVERVDVVISSGPPHSAHLTGAAIARRLGVPHVVDLRDRWTDNPLQTSVFPWRQFFDRVLENHVLRSAAHVVVVSEPEVQRLQKRVRSGRVTFIPNGFDPEDLATLPPRRVVGEAALVRFFFAGSLRDRQETGYFFEVFGAKIRDGLSLTMMGEIDATHATAARAAIPSDRLLMLPAASHREALVEMAGADVLVVFTGGGGLGSATMTGKLYEYLALRRPVVVIGPAGPAVDLVERSTAGAAARSSDRKGIADAIEEVMRLARDPGFKGMDAELLAPYDRRRLAGQWSVLLTEAIQPGPSQ